MVEQGYGAIVNISSDRAFSTNPGRLAYCAARRVVAMTKVAAVEWGPHACVSTRSRRRVPDGDVDRAVASGISMPSITSERFPLGHVGDPSDVATPSRIWCRIERDTSPGEVLTVDGGLTRCRLDSGRPTTA